MTVEIVLEYDLLSFVKKSQMKCVIRDHFVVKFYISEQQI